MPVKKRRFNRKSSKDKKQDSRIRSLENFVYKTIENKQQNFHQAELDVLDVGRYSRPSLKLVVGSEDGDDRPDAARIGNSVTLMRERYNFELRTTAGSNQTMRLIVVESKDGSEDLIFDDILQFWKRQAGTADGTMRQTYTSHYTTKSAENKRYKIHFDKTYTFNPTGKGQVFRPKVDIKHGTKKNPGKVVEYSSAIDDVPVNHKITIMAVSDQLSGGNVPKMSYSSRLTYKDA